MTRLKHEGALKGLPKWVLYILLLICRGNPPYIFLQKSLFTHLRRRGMPVLFLGVNTEKDLNLAISIGATAILSDKITSIHQYLSARPHLEFKKIEA